jgi:hypothetical protein
LVFRWRHDPEVNVRRAKSALQTASCHCGAVRIHVLRLPRTLTACNCSICRRYGTLWAYYRPTSVRIEAPRGGLVRYSWNKRVRFYYRCATCGCITHYEHRKNRLLNTCGVNANNFEPVVVSACKIRHFDGAGTWKYFD